MGRVSRETTQRSISGPASEVALTAKVRYPADSNQALYWLGVIG